MPNLNPLQFTGRYDMLTDSFYEPAKVRILETCDFDSSNSSVVLKIQGENKVGGTLNHYYKVYYASEKYTELSNYYTPKDDASHAVYAPRLNKALKEYWAEMGLD